jgi:excisionase family DNA binding protein
MIVTPKSPVPVILVDAREASRLLAICPRTLWQLTRSGVVPSIRIGRSVRYRVADLESWTLNRSKGI